MFQDLKELLSAFHDHSVKCLVVGGYAVGVYSEPRATKSLDLLIRVDKDNGEALYRALAACGTPLDGICPEDFTDGSSAFQIGLPPLRIDILQKIEAVSFDEAWEVRLEALIDGQLSAYVISRNHLIRNKLAFGRPRDLIEVEAMRQAALANEACAVAVTRDAVPS